jgi:hypothetical protein
MIKSFGQSVRLLLIVFILLTAFFISGKGWLDKKGIDNTVLLYGNLLLFLVSFSAFFITRKSLDSANPQAFIRAMYGSFMIKFFTVAIASFIYILLMKKNVNKPALLICAVLYILYTIIETRELTKLLKQKKNA